MKTLDKKTVRMSVAQYAKQVKQSRQYVARLAAANKIEGAQCSKVGRAYVIEFTPEK